jgi:hypothetical protein
METRPFGRPRGASEDDHPDRPRAAQAVLSAPVLPGAAGDRGRGDHRPFLAGPGRKPQAAGRRLHQAGEDDHRAGDLPDRDHRHRRHARPGQGRPGGPEGLRLFPGVLDPGPDHRPDRRQRRPSRRGHEHRPGHPGHDEDRGLFGQGPRPDDRRLPAAHHPGHRGQRLRRGRDPAGAVLLDPVRPVAGHDRRSRPAGPDLPGGDRRGVLPPGARADEGRADRGVRGLRLHHRQVRHRLDRQPRGPGGDLLPDLAVLRGGGPGRSWPRPTASRSSS